MHPGRSRQFAVYILSSRSRTLYTGVTGDLVRRVYAHKHRLIAGFTCRYHIDQLVYFELTENARAAIGREKQIKGWSRSKKIRMIESQNPKWQDLARDWYADQVPRHPE